MRNITILARKYWELDEIRCVCARFFYSWFSVAYMRDTGSNAIIKWNIVVGRRLNSRWPCCVRVRSTAPLFSSLTPITLNLRQCRGVFTSLVMYNIFSTWYCLGPLSFRQFAFDVDIIRLRETKNKYIRTGWQFLY